MGINLDEFSRRLAEDRGYSYAMARTACRDVFDELIDIFSEHETLTVNGFGKFEIKSRRQTGAIPKWAKKTDIEKLENYPVIKFTPAQNLKKAMYIEAPVYHGHIPEDRDFSGEKKTGKFIRRAHHMSDKDGGSVNGG